MPGHRPIFGCDIHAQLRHQGPPDADIGALEAWVDEEDFFYTVDELAAACPPERIGLRPGAFASVFGPLFGELE